MSKNLEKHFENKEQIFFERLKPFIKKTDRVLKIGNGFGYLSRTISNYVRDMSVYELHVFPKTINKAQVRIYDGKTIPEEDKSFDVAVFNLVFHHIPNNRDYLRQTVAKTKRYIILYEQTYDNIIQKIQLVWRDWHINRKAGTPSKIYWSSYLKRSELDKFVGNLGVEIIHRETKHSHLYYKELIVLKIK